MGIVFVEQGDVVINVLVVDIHSPHAVLDDHRQFIGIGRVVGHAAGDGGGQHMAVAVVMLQAFAHQCGSAGRGAEQKPPGAGIASGPGEVADALEAEHRVENVEGHRHHAMGAVGSARGDPGRNPAGFVQAFLHDLAVPGFLVIAQLTGVLRRVQLTDMGMDADLAEQGFHAEGA
ncbi:hypothetical protein D3C78_1270840 [compost metagenome]